MKKAIFTSVIVPGLLIASTVFAANYTFANYLKVGSTGADVVALQTWLVDGGFLVMPAGVSKGYFGQLTKSAVVKYQASVGLPATGFVGPLTVAKLNGSAVAMVPAAGCPAGYTCTPVNSPATPGPVVMNGTDGSSVITYLPYAPSSQTLKKGDMDKPVIAVTVLATGGPVTVSRLDVSFSDRPWLYFSKVTLKDSTGKVLATKFISSSADATEVVVGSNYFVRFEGINYVANPGPATGLIVTLDVLAASDKINNNVVYIGIPTGNVRTINGKGYTESLGISSSTGSSVSSATGVAVTLSSTGSTGSITTRVSPSSPIKRTIAVSPTNVTADVTLGVFGLKSQNQTSKISSLTFVINSTSSVATTTLYSNVRLYKDSTLIAGANSLNGAATFTNMVLDLPTDQWVDVKLVADIPAGQGGQSASSTLAGGALIVGTDTNFNSLTVSGASSQSSSDNVYSYSGINIVGSAPTLANCANTYEGTNTNVTSCEMTFTLTLSAAANNAGDLFISKLPGTVLATSSSVMTASTTLTTVTGVAAIAGDTTVSYRIPTEGRTFTYKGTFSKTGGAAALETFQINKIWFGTTATAGATGTAATHASSFIDYGLEQLTVSRTI